MYGIGPYAQVPFASSNTGASDITCALSVPLSLEVYLDAVVGVTCTLPIPLPLVVNIGSDTDLRTATIAAEAGLQASFTSTIPVYAVGLINPVVTAAFSGNTTVSGTFAVALSPVVSVVGMVPNLTTLALTIPVLPTIVGFTPPSMALAASIAPVASITGSAPPSARMLLTLPVMTSIQATIGIPAVLAVAPQIAVSFASVCGVTGSIAANIAPKVVMYGGSPTQSVLAATIPISPLFSVFTAPVANLSARVDVDFSLTAFAPLSGYISNVLSPEVSLASVVGTTATISASLRAVFSGTAARGASATVGATLHPAVSMSARTGQAGEINASIPVAVSILGEALQLVQGSLDAYPNVTVTLRGLFGDVVEYPDCVYVKTKSSSVSVLQ